MTVASKRHIFISMSEKEEKQPLFFAGLKIQEGQNDEMNLILRNKKRKCLEANLKIDQEENIDFSLIPESKEVKICIQTQCRETFSLTVQKSLSILDLKRQIQIERDILLEKQNLFFNGELLDNEKTLDSCKIQSESILYLVKCAFEGTRQIFVNHCGKIFTLNITAFDTIQKIKCLIQERTQIPLDYQILNHSGRILDWKIPASFYNIEKESTIFLSTRIVGKKFVFLAQSR